LIGALNGLAALLILEQDHASAVKTYREALSLMEENFEEFDVDPLQKLHVLHNLNEILETLRSSSAVDEGQLTKSDAVEGDLVATPPVKKQRADNMHDISGNFHIPRTLRDELLQQQSREISSKYMSSFDAKLTAARSDYKNAHNQVFFPLNTLGCFCVFIWSE
jgi:E3 ubiquitin-protein ligase SHPRH